MSEHQHPRVRSDTPRPLRRSRLLVVAGVAAAVIGSSSGAAVAGESGPGQSGHPACGLRLCADLIRHDSADQRAVRLGRPVVLRAGGNSRVVQRQPVVRPRHRRAWSDDRHRRLLRQRHDGTRSARVRPGFRRRADVRRGRGDLHRLACQRSLFCPYRVRRLRRRHLRRRRAPGKRTRPLGRSRSPSTSRCRMPWHPAPTSCW